MARIAMTGATGAVGGAIRDELLARGHTVSAIGRHAEVIWDLRQPLPPAALDAMREADVVVHAAADIRLAERGTELHRVNVEAVEELVRALEGLARPPRLVHVSSAFADTSGSRQPHNGYERSKQQGEAIVRESNLDATVLRPSLVVGSRVDGAIKRFSGIFIFIRMLRLGLIPAIPGFSHVGVDIIPVDVVAEAAVQAIEAPGERRVIGITAGAEAPRLEELVTAACDIFDAHGPEPVDRPKFVEPEVYHRLFRPMVLDRVSPAQRVLLKTVEVFLPYFERDHVFESDIRLTRCELLDAWTRSVSGWLRTTHPEAPRGRAVWARRS